MPTFSVGSELEKARHKLFNYAVKNLNEAIVDNRRDDFLSNLIFAAIVNLDFWVLFENIYHGVFRQLYTHKNFTLLDW